MAPNLGAGRKGYRAGATLDSSGFGAEMGSEHEEMKVLKGELTSDALAHSHLVRFDTIGDTGKVVEGSTRQRIDNAKTQDLRQADDFAPARFRVSLYLALAARGESRE